MPVLGRKKTGLPQQDLILGDLMGRGMIHGLIKRTGRLVKFLCLKKRPSHPDKDVQLFSGALRQRQGFLIGFRRPGVLFQIIIRLGNIIARVKNLPGRRICLDEFLELKDGAFIKSGVVIALTGLEQGVLCQVVGRKQLD